MFFINKQLVHVIVLFSIVYSLVLFYKHDIFPEVKTIRAFGELKADVGALTGEPVFNSLGIAPGESEVKMITIVNDSNEKKLVFLNGMSKTITNNNAITLTIEDGTKHFYGAGSSTGKKTLTDFFRDSNNPYGIMLTTIDPEKRKTFLLNVSYPESLTDMQQAYPVQFDISFASIKL